jgi:hypothetical protein
MSCSWCDYDLDKVSPGFSGYMIFNSFGETMSYRVCSMNCGVAQIYELGTQVDLRVEKLLNYYQVSSYIYPAKPRTKLTKFGGTLSYSVYRRDFICPYGEPEEDYDYEDDYDNPYRISSYERDECDGW